MSIVADAVSVVLGGRRVVQDVSMRLEPGRLVGVLGPNGAGKSTLVRALLALVRSDGEIRIDDVPVRAISRDRLARQVAYLPQGHVVHWPMAVERVVALGRVPHLTPVSRLTAADQEAIAAAMAQAEVSHLAMRTVTELSGGERARVLLARALAVEAPALIADEPLASLDPAHQIQGMEILRARADAGGLVVAVLHDLTLAARYCDRVLVMADGHLVADGPPSQVLTPALLAQVYGVTAWFGDDAKRLIVPLDRVR